MTKLEAAQMKHSKDGYTDKEIIDEYCPRMLGVGDELINIQCEASSHLDEYTCYDCWIQKYVV